MNKLYYGDCLTVMDEYLPPRSVDLIYLDPPFNSNRAYNAIYKDETGRPLPDQIEAFCDLWALDTERERAIQYMPIRMREAGIDDTAAQLWKLWLHALRHTQPRLLAYLSYMVERLLRMKLLLKPTGSIYLHCDPTASHYIKALMDAIFGHENFRNEIVWKRTTTHSDSKTWSRVSDTILFYSKGQRITWNTPHVPHSDEYVASKYRHDDGDGRRYRLDNMTSPNPRPNMMYDWKGSPSPAKGWRYSKETMAQMDEAGRIWYPAFKDGTYNTSRRPQLKRYLDEMKGGVMGNVWSDIPPINSQAKERLGYPTQKPLALLNRVIQASSNEGDVVFDPFCGCATTLVAADRLNRKWIGIDVSPKAVELVTRRIKDDQGLFRHVVSRQDVPRRTDLGRLPHYTSHKNALYGEQGGNCTGCGEHFQRHHLEVDHIIARSEGGTDHIGNLQLLCSHCNRLKGNRGQEYLVARLWELDRASHAIRPWFDGRAAV